ncbi:MAG: hypothetical protein IJ427_03385, partial [Lachnospiraceae bacterium]|nr:hypothetical protein [Lachnospiraceae bacterium]
MNIKTFKGKTEDEAMELAKKELGEHVVKMASRKVEPKGFFGKLFGQPVWEVTAAVDEPDVYERTIPRKPVQQTPEVRYMPSGNRPKEQELLFEESKDEKGANAIERRLMRLAEADNIPLTGSMELLPLCNLNCDMCYVRLSRAEMEAR